MPTKKKTKAKAKAKGSGKMTQAEQSARFIAKARELGIEDSPDAFNRAIKTIIPPKTGKKSP
jgi:hypothetical protein